MGAGGERERLVLRTSDDYRGKNVLAPMVRVVSSERKNTRARSSRASIPSPHNSRGPPGYAGNATCPFRALLR
eukprot:3046755-Pyramimonas_sp.AAC.2